MTRHEEHASNTLQETVCSAYAPLHTIKTYTHTPNLTFTSYLSSRRCIIHTSTGTAGTTPKPNDNSLMLDRNVNPEQHTVRCRARELSGSIWTWAVRTLSASATCGSTLSMVPRSSRGFSPGATSSRAPGTGEKGTAHCSFG